MNETKNLEANTIQDEALIKSIERFLTLKKALLEIESANIGEYGECSNATIGAIIDKVKAKGYFN